MDNVNKNTTPPPKNSEDSWGYFVKFNERQFKKVAWVLSILSTVLVTGFFIGRFYENLQNKFEISELKTKHSEEIQKIRNEFVINQLKEMKDTQNNLIQSTVIKEGGDNEK